MNPTTQLLRQINPAFVQEDRVTSQAFRPTPKDENHLSVYNGDQISAQAAWEHFVSNPVCNSVGVMAVTFDECQKHSLPVYADGIGYKEHCTIDFSEFKEKDIKKKAKVLSAYASARGWLFQGVSCPK
jgi:hypothetical protein